jgi:hypothetical protein
VHKSSSAALELLVADPYSYELKFLYQSGRPHVGVLVWQNVIPLNLFEIGEKVIQNKVIRFLKFQIVNSD